ncbi:MAG: NAD(P)-dependent oxidoreductase [bacterium]|nr:NAD(P)-dependent oxidoreductase [bacterium]
MRILLYDDEQEFYDLLRPLLDREIELQLATTIDESVDSEVLVCGTPSEELIDRLPALKTVIVPWAGIPKKTLALLRTRPKLALHNLHYNAVIVAETAVTLMLAASRQLLRLDSNLRKGDWSLRYGAYAPPLLSGRTAVILGYGAIGQRIATICRALGMNLILVGRRVPEAKGECHSFADLDSLLPKAEFLLVSLPWTEETDSLFDQQRLSLLPDNSTIVNIARGAILDEAALYKELSSGRLTAGLDVWYNYPREEGERTRTAPSRFDFGSLPNVLMTPHIAGHSDRSESLRADELAEILNEHVAGGPLRNRVDVSLGY